MPRPELEAFAASQYGLFTRRQALSCGFSEDEIRRLVGREWTQLRRGVYIESRLWKELDTRERHVIAVRAAFFRIRGDRLAAASHWSAAAVHNLAVYQPPDDAVHVTRSHFVNPRIEAGIHHHVGELQPVDVTTIKGICVTGLARTIVDIACTASFESALVTADHAMRLGLTSEALKDQYLRHTAWAGSTMAANVIRFADGRAESPGETLSRVVFMKIGLPPPELQTTFFTSNGAVFARTDFGWDELFTVAEFDGKVKYLRGAREGEDPGDVVFREKIREDRLRDEYQREVFRLTNQDLKPYSLDNVRVRAFAAFSRAAKRHGFDLEARLRQLRSR